MWYTYLIDGIFISDVLKMLSILRQSNHRDRFFKIFPHIPLKKKRSRRNFVHGLRSLSLTRQPTFSHILLLVVGKYDEFQKRWLWNLPQRESQKYYHHSCKLNLTFINLITSDIFMKIAITMRKRFSLSLYVGCHRFLFEYYLIALKRPIRFELGL